MYYTSSVTQKGQVTLPKKLRDALRIDVREKVIVEAASDHIKIFPTKDILSLAGKISVKSNKKFNALKARELFDETYERK